MEELQKIVMDRQWYLNRGEQEMLNLYYSHLMPTYMHIKYKYIMKITVLKNLDKFDVVFLSLCIPILMIAILLGVKVGFRIMKAIVSTFSISNMERIFINSTIIRKQREKQTANSIIEYRQSIQHSIIKPTTTMPINGLKPNRIIERFTEWKQAENKNIHLTKQSGTIYIEDGEMKQLVQEFSSRYLFMNMKDRNIFSSLRQMENEVISMTCQLLNSKNNYAIVTQGGTESILTAIYAYREYYKKTRNITEPNIVMSDNAHVAFDKACFYLGVKCIKVKQGKDYKADAKQMARKVNRNTICIIGSCPNFQSGNIDDFEALGKIADKHQIGLHVDMCLGSFVACFGPKTKIEGISYPDDYDFRNPFITSISIDHHKYGLSPKGVSCIVFRDKEIRQSAYYVKGSYYTVNMMENQTAASIAGCWFHMMYYGQNKYINYVKSIIQTTQFLVTTFKNIKEIEVLGKPILNVVAIRSVAKDINIYSIQYALTKLGWELNGLQNPASIHIAVTQANYKQCLELPKLINQVIVQIRANPAQYKGGSCAIYGTTSQVPNAKIIGDVLREIQDVTIKA